MMLRTLLLSYLVLLVPLGSADTLTFRWELSADQRTDVREKFEDAALQSALQKFLQRNFASETGYEFIFQSAGEVIFDDRSRRSYLPAGLFNEISENLNRRYPEQSEAREKVFLATAQLVIWRHLAKHIVSHYKLSIEGDEVFALDRLTLFLWLHFDDSDYLLDAVEEFLVVNTGPRLLLDRAYQDEFALDKARYQRIACLVLGKDSRQFNDQLAALSWDEKQLKRCRESYLLELAYWREKLAPFLTKDSLLRP